MARILKGGGGGKGPAPKKKKKKITFFLNFIPN